MELELYFSVWNWNYWYGVRWLSTTIERTNIHGRTIIPGILGVQLSMGVQLSLSVQLFSHQMKKTRFFWKVMGNVFNIYDVWSSLLNQRCTVSCIEFKFFIWLCTIWCGERDSWTGKTCTAVLVFKIKPKLNGVERERERERER